jgi:hypothetical protein
MVGDGLTRLADGELNYRTGSGSDLAVSMPLNQTALEFKIIW